MLLWNEIGQGLGATLGNFEKGLICGSIRVGRNCL